MSKFSDLMAQPLPSAQKANEVVEDIKTESVKPEAKSEESLIESMDDLIMEFEDDVEADEVEVVQPLDSTVAAAVVDEPAEGEEVDNEPLTPAESNNVDGVIDAVATPLLLRESLNEDEIMEFVNSMDSDIAVSEGFLMEKTIIKFDKKAKKAQLYEVAVAAVAREKKDPLYKKLNTVYKMERILKAKLRKKYNSQAQQKVKEYLARAKRSKSGILSRIANKIMGR